MIYSITSALSCLNWPVSHSILFAHTFIYRGTYLPSVEYPKMQEKKRMAQICQNHLQFLIFTNMVFMTNAVFIRAYCCICKELIECGNVIIVSKL